VASLGRFFEDGLGLKADDEAAVKYYQLAAEQGEPYAQLRLGTFYRTGRAVPKDIVTALMWLNLAAAQGQGEVVRDLVAGTMTAQQVEEANRRTDEFLTRVTGAKTGAAATP
jgi:TPR repeat protein